MKKILLTFSLIIIILITTCFSSYAVFTAELPEYVNYSGGAWFEVFHSDFGRCTVIFPLEFKDNCFGFKLSAAGMPVDIYNFTNTTIYGLVVTSNGKEYSCRASRFSPIEVQSSTTGYQTYVNLNPDSVALSNSNMLFITDDENYYNDTVMNYDNYYLVALSIIAFCSFFGLCVNLFRRGRRT